MGALNAESARPVRWQALVTGADRLRWPITAAVVLLALWLRASDLKADPPSDLSWSFAPYTDEGLNTYSARNLVLYGAWKVDDFNPYVVYPLVNMLVALVFRLLGIGFVQVKLVSVAAGTLSVLLLYLLVREDAGSLAGLVAGLVLATCFPLVMYSRLGLVESVQILFLLCTGLFWVQGLRRSRLMFWSGLFATGTILFVKASAIFLAPAMLTLFAWQLAEVRTDPAARRQLIRGLLWLLVGAAVAAAAWFAAVFLPFRGEYVRYIARHSVESPQGHPRGPVAYLFNTFIVGLRARLLQRLVWTSLVGFAVLPFWSVGRKPGMRYLLLWFVSGLLMLGYMNYRPPRYELILIPALLAGFGAALGRLLETGTILPASRPNLLKSLLYSLWLWPLAAQLLIFAFRLNLFPEPGAEGGPVLAALAPALAVGLGGMLMVRRLRSGLAVRSPRVRAALAGVLLLLTLRLDLGQFRSWFTLRTHNIIAGARDLATLLPADAVVAGSWAPTLMLESDRKTVAITDWANVCDPVGRLGVTHIIIGEGPVDRILAEAVGHPLLARSTVLRRYSVSSQVWTQTLRLVALPKGPPSP